MGGRLVSHVVSLSFLGHLGGLSKSAWAVLIVMASVARDAPAKEPALYFGGWPYLAQAALGYEVHTPAAHRAVGRAMAELVAAGLVKPEGEPAPTRRQAYRLTLPPAL